MAKLLLESLNKLFPAHKQCVRLHAGRLQVPTYTICSVYIVVMESANCGAETSGKGVNISHGLAVDFRHSSHLRM